MHAMGLPRDTLISQSTGGRRGSLSDRHARAAFHISMATRLATSGISMLIEKPLSLNMDGIEQLREIVRPRALVAAVGYVLRANPPLKAMRDAIRRGRFGQPQRSSPFPVSIFQRIVRPTSDTYYARRGSGGGAIQDAFTHIVIWANGWSDRSPGSSPMQVMVLPGCGGERDTGACASRHHRVLGCYSLNQFQTP